MPVRSAHGNRSLAAKMNGEKTVRLREATQEGMDQCAVKMA